MVEILFCLFMLGSCLYLWHVTRLIDNILEELLDFLKGADKDE